MKLKPKQIRFGWQFLPRKKKKYAKKLFNKIINTDYLNNEKINKNASLQE